MSAISDVIKLFKYTWGDYVYKRCEKMLLKCIKGTTYKQLTFDFPED